MEHCPRMIQRIFDMNIKKHFLLLLCGWISFHSCITLDIRRDWDTSSDRRKASQYTDHIPVTAQEIKECLITDTAHYKVVLIYGLACPNCSDMFKNITPVDGSKQIRLIYVGILSKTVVVD